jgi:hypothetical protein
MYRVIHMVLTDKNAHVNQIRCEFHGAFFLPRHENQTRQSPQSDNPPWWLFVMDPDQLPGVEYEGTCFMGVNAGIGLWERIWGAR